MDRPPRRQVCAAKTMLPMPRLTVWADRWAAWGNRSCLFAHSRQFRTAHRRRVRVAAPYE